MIIFLGWKIVLFMVLKWLYFWLTNGNIFGKKKIIIMVKKFYFLTSYIFGQTMVIFLLVIFLAVIYLVKPWLFFWWSYV